MISSLKKALSMRTSIETPGRAARTIAIQLRMKSSMGVMDVAGTMQHIEHLAGLGDRAEERVVAALPLLLAVKPYWVASLLMPGCASRLRIERDWKARAKDGPVWRAEEAATDPLLRPPPLWQ